MSAPAKTEAALAARGAPAQPVPIRASGTPRLGLWAAVVGSILLRLTLLEFQSGDYRAFLSRWYDYFVQHGVWRGTGAPTSDFASYSYPPLYLYLISLSTLLPLPKLYALKLISVFPDYIAAWYGWRIARRDGGFARWGWALPALILFLPTVVLNSALWGQVDMMYTCALVASLYYVLERRPVAALVAFGLACSVKPQAFFWAPFILGLLMSGRLPWKQVWIPAAVYFGCAAPALLAGRPPLDALAHWASAAGHPMGLCLGAPNWYQWVFGQTSAMLYGAGLGLAMGAIAAQLWWMRRPPPPAEAESRWLVAMALLAVLLPPFLLPGVHERYFFAADVVSLIYVFFNPRQWIVALLVQSASALSYLPYLFGIEPVPRWCLAVLTVVAIEVVVIKAVSLAHPRENSRLA